MFQLEMLQGFNEQGIMCGEKSRIWKEGSQTIKTYYSDNRMGKLRKNTCVSASMRFSNQHVVL